MPLVGRPPAAPDPITESPFDVLVDSLNPYAWYKFEEDEPDDNNVTITDSSGNGRHLKVVSPAVEYLQVVPPARIYSKQALTWGHTRSRSTYFRDNDNRMNSLPSGSTAITVQWSWAFHPADCSFSQVLGWRANNTSASLSCLTQWATGKQIQPQFRASNGTIYTRSWAPPDEKIRLFTMRWDNGKYAFFRNGSKDEATAPVTALATYSDQFEFPGTTSGDTGCAMMSDHLAIWNSALSDADINAMHDAYEAELVSNHQK